MIYATPYDPATLKPTDLSTDSGFTSFDDLVMMLGEPSIKYQRWVGYPDIGMAYSNFPFYLGPSACIN